MNPPCILVVDDEQLIRWSLVKHLQRAGHHVVGAESGEAALTELCDEIALVLLDFKLPDTNGLALLKQIKHDHPGCQVILMTAFGSAETAREAQALGAYQVIHKPFSLAEMGQLVEKALGSRQATGTT